MAFIALHNLTQPTYCTKSHISPVLHPQLLIIFQRQYAVSCFHVFFYYILPSGWNVLSYTAHILSFFESWLKCPLLREAFPEQKLQPPRTCLAFHTLLSASFFSIALVTI